MIEPLIAAEIVFMNPMKNANRRKFLAWSAAGLLANTSRPAMGMKARPPQILLRGSWQSVNIGDIGHTPGALGLLEKYLPEAEVTLWVGSEGAGVRDPLGLGAREMLVAAYPRLKIVSGTIGKDNLPTTEALSTAWKETDFYLSGSGSGFPAATHAIAFHRATGKPVGVFGVSNDPISGFGNGRDPEGGTLNSLRERAMNLPASHLDAQLRYIMDRASFFFCRDTITRDYLKSQGVQSPCVEFGPDAQLGMRLRDDVRGDAFLAANQLQPGKFICVVPRLRYTPYYQIRGTAPTTVDREKDAINDRTTETDHSKLRAMIIKYIQSTGNKVLVCAEMTYQIEVGKKVLVDPLPDQIRDQVVWRNSFWLPDEAASIYARAECVVSMECHSPLIAVHQGTPFLHVRQPTDTCKGQMYRDIGASDWLFEIDLTSGEQLWERLAGIHREPARARADAKAIMSSVEANQQHMVETLRTNLA